MEAFLGKITQHAMNYAIRSGIGITATFAISQTSRLLRTVDNNADYQELHDLQERLESKIRIVTPAIDLIDLISSRGNTTLESAVTLTKSIRLDIQSLGVRLAKAATAEELSRKVHSKVKSRPAHEIEIRQIVQSIRKLLTRIEDAVPLINLAITTSGASLSTTLPASVSPSRLLQASTFLTAGDHLYSKNPAIAAQVGPTFTLTLYMLFAGHVNRPHDTDSMRDTTWKEVIHKAKVRLLRIPLRSIYSSPTTSSTEQKKSDTHPAESIEVGEEPMMPGEGSASEFAYHLDIVEDLDDDRVHTFEENEPQPGPYGDVEHAGIREKLPVYQISKIFYANTGKILNIGSHGETNNPVLLLKRNINSRPPRAMMGKDESSYVPATIPDDEPAPDGNVEDGESQDDIDRQLRRESSIHVAADTDKIPQQSEVSGAWRLPPDLDTEWMALEVYTEVEESDSDDGQEVNDDSAYVSHRPSSSGQGGLVSELANLKLDSNLPSPKPASPSQISAATPIHAAVSPKQSPFGPVRTSLSLLEMLIRLTSLQEFQQASHLATPDELLTFFLEESSTTGGDGDERRRTRIEARRKVGFDPYDESPIKRRGEDYQYQDNDQEGYQGYSREATPYDDYDRRGSYGPHGSPAFPRQSPRATPEPWLLRSREVSFGSILDTPENVPSSPISPYRPLNRKPMGPLDRINQERGRMKNGSPLGRGMSVETDSTLGTSPGSPALVDRKDKATEI